MLVTNIQRFSLHDGAGIRTVAFMKGCTLKCRWCHNPETISRNKQVLFRQSKCIGCQTCRKACESINGEFILLSNIPEICADCVNCLKCAEVCPSGAIEILGKEYAAEELYCELIKDREFYIESGGGVTFSGGEPLLHIFELLPVIKMLAEENISIDFETAGNVKWANFEAVLPYMRDKADTDEFLFDIKCIGEEAHKQGTGASNKLILENFKKLYDAGKNITARIPVIPGFNADENNIKDIASFLRDYPKIKHAEFMPFHAIASHKYHEMNLINEYAEYKSISADSDMIKKFKEIFREYGIKI